MTKLSGGNLLALLPASISNDPQMRAAAEALRPVLTALSLSVPNLLIYARLGGQPVETMLPPLARLTQARGGLNPLSLDELEQLAWQFHVDFRDVATSREQLAAMVRNSIPWHRIKGTPASIKKALALFGIEATIEEDGRGDDWATYQVGVTGTPDMATARKIYQVATEMAPARCRLFRVYNDLYDFRPLYLSDGPDIGDGWLSFYSGVTVPGIGDDEDAPLVSFGAELSMGGEPLGSRIWSGFSSSLNIDGMYEDCFILGTSCLSDDYPLNHGFIFSQLFSWQNAEPVTTSHKWAGKWDRRHWSEPAGWTRTIPPWVFGMLTFYKSELRIGWPDDSGGLVHGSGTIGDINACVGVRSVQHFDDPFILGESLLSDHDPDLHDDLIEEYFIAPPIAVGAPALNPHLPGFALGGVFGLHIVPLRNQRWNGSWQGGRRWWNYRAEYGLNAVQSAGTGAPLAESAVRSGRQSLFCAQGEPVTPTAPQSGRSGSANHQGAALHNQKWNGSWRDGRRWWNYLGGCAAVTTRQS